MPKGDLKETVELDDAINQVNASDVYALQDYPLHNLSGYAGWAINSEITQTTSKESSLLITRSIPAMHGVIPKGSLFKQGHVIG